MVIMAEDRMDAAHDYLAEHYRELIEYEDIINFIESIPQFQSQDLYELRNILNKKIQEMEEK